MAAATQSLQNALQHPEFENKVFETAQRALQSTSGLQGLQGDDEWLRQAVRGFVNVILEAAVDTSTEVRDTFWHTVLPGLLADGQAPAPLFKSSATFLFLLGTQLMLDVPQTEQSGARVWFATFAGSYIQDLYVACMEAAAP